MREVAVRKQRDMTALAFVVFILIITLLVFVNASLTACTVSGEKSIRNDLTKSLDAIKKANPEALGQLSEQLALGEQFGIEPKEFAKVWFEGFSYSIESIVIDGQTATVKIAVTSRQLMSLLDEALSDIGAVMNDPALQDDIEAQYKKAGQILLDKLRAQPLKTLRLELIYHQENGKWIMDANSWQDIIVELTR